MAGNHVILDCGGVWVVLAHLRRGTCLVHEGTRVRVGDPIGEVGNSGNTNEPHLHIHAQMPGTAQAPLSGRPVAILLNGRYLARNDMVFEAGGR
jgi:murein DD-endopeptidase MepM/ murein hydrolase activator NlpD